MEPGGPKGQVAGAGHQSRFGLPSEGMASASMQGLSSAEVGWFVTRSDQVAGDRILPGTS